MVWLSFLAGAIALAVAGGAWQKIRSVSATNQALEAELGALRTSISDAGDRADAANASAAAARRDVSSVRERVEEVNRHRSNTLADTRATLDGQRRLNEELRSGVQDAKERAADGLVRAKDLSGEPIHGSKRTVTDDERATLLQIAHEDLGLTWLDARHVLYLIHAVPALESRLRGRLAAPSAAMVLRALVAMASPEPGRVLEIGTLYGHSAAFMHEIVEPTKHGFHQTIIDPFFGYYEHDAPDLFVPIPITESVFVDNMSRVGATDETLEVIVGLAEDPPILQRLADRRFDLLVIDGDHSLDGVRRDFENYAGAVEPGGYIIIDDYQGLSWPDVTTYVDDVVFTDQRFEVVTGEMRTAVVRRK